MAVVATFNEKLASDVVVYEEMTARFSREQVKITGAVKVGDLLKETISGGLAIVQAITNPAELNTAKYVAIYNSADGFNAVDMAVIARHAIVRNEALNWPTGTTDAQKQLAIDELNKAQLLVRKQGVM